jgi:hypothetical protein
MEFMKNLLFLFVSLFLFACTENKKVKNDWTEENLKGEVKLITDSLYKAVEKDGVIQKDSFKYTGISIFNNMGYLLYDSSYKDGKEIFKLIQKYDDRNNCLDRISYKNCKVSYHRIRQYDEHNNETVEIEFEPYQGNSQTNNLKDSVVKNESHYSYKYDSNGNIIENIATQNRKPWFRFEYTWDNKGNEIQEKQYYAWDKTLSGYNKTKYDSMGNELERDCYDADSVLYFKFIMKYDKNGYKTQEMARRRGDTIEMDEVMAYDDRGNRIRDIDYDKDSIVHWDMRYEFKKFDSKGNWHESIFYNKGKLETITKRTIEYY